MSPGACGEVAYTLPSSDNLTMRWIASPTYFTTLSASSWLSPTCLTRMSRTTPGDKLSPGWNRTSTMAFRLLRADDETPSDERSCTPGYLARQSASPLLSTRGTDSARCHLSDADSRPQADDSAHGPPWRSARAMAALLADRWSRPGPPSPGRAASRRPTPPAGGSTADGMISWAGLRKGARPGPAEQEKRLAYFASSAAGFLALVLALLWP